MPALGGVGSKQITFGKGSFSCIVNPVQPRRSNVSLLFHRHVFALDNLLHPLRLRPPQGEKSPKPGLDAQHRNRRSNSNPARRCGSRPIGWAVGTEFQNPHHRGRTCLRAHESSLCHLDQLSRRIHLSHNADVHRPHLSIRRHPLEFTGSVRRHSHIRLLRSGQCSRVHSYT